MNQLVVFGVSRGGRRSPSGRPMSAGPKSIHDEPDFYRRSDKMIDLHRARHFGSADPVQAGAGGASTLRAIRRAAENARFDPSFKVGRIVCGHLRKETIVRILWGMQKRLGNTFIEQQLRISFFERR